MQRGCKEKKQNKTHSGPENSTEVLMGVGVGVGRAPGHAVAGHVVWVQVF